MNLLSFTSKRITCGLLIGALFSPSIQSQAKPQLKTPQVGFIKVFVEKKAQGHSVPVSKAQLRIMKPSGIKLPHYHKPTTPKDLDTTLIPKEENGQDASNFSKVEDETVQKAQKIISELKQELDEKTSTLQALNDEVKHTKETYIQLKGHFEEQDKHKKQLELALTKTKAKLLEADKTIIKLQASADKSIPNEQSNKNTTQLNDLRGKYAALQLDNAAVVEKLSDLRSENASLKEKLELKESKRQSSTSPRFLPTETKLTTNTVAKKPSNTDSSSRQKTPIIHKDSLGKKDRTTVENSTEVIVAAKPKATFMETSDKSSANTEEVSQKNPIIPNSEEASPVTKQTEHRKNIKVTPNNEVKKSIENDSPIAPRDPIKTIADPVKVSSVKATTESKNVANSSSKDTDSRLSSTASFKPSLKSQTSKTKSEESVAKSQPQKSILSGLEDDNGKYTIQLLSSTNKSFINKRLKKLLSIGLPAWKASKKIKGKDYYRLRVGRYKNSKNARAASKVYQKNYSEKPFITRAR